MRHFFYTIQSEKISRTYGGADVKVNIYRIVKGEYKLVATASWCTRGYCGEETEVMRALVREKQIPKSWVPENNYYTRNNTKFQIRRA